MNADLNVRSSAFIRGLNLTPVPRRFLLTIVDEGQRRPANRPSPLIQQRCSARASTRPFPSALHTTCSLLASAVRLDCLDKTAPQSRKNARSPLQPGPGLCAPASLSPPVPHATSHPEAQQE